MRRNFLDNKPFAMRSYRYPIILVFFVSFVMSSTSCKKDLGLNIFTVQDDIDLGKQVEQQIASDPATYPILPEAQYQGVYNYVYNIRDKILNSGQVTHKSDFAWSVKVIHDDNTLNAFCVSGGYIYVYTGLLKYLDTEDELAGVLGHEMAHADRRHTTNQMTQQYGIETLLNVVLGSDSNTLAQIGASLLTLKFSRDDEAEADKYSVIYLCPTDYNSAGAAGFFTKLIAQQQTGNTPQFLSDHPSPDNRVQAINDEKATLACTGTATYDAQYAAFKAQLP
jgi:predicted Zn-dependent protease